MRTPSKRKSDESFETCRLQRFSELCENLRVSSHQILTSELTGWKPRLRNHCSSCNNISTCTSKHPSFYVTGDSLSPVRFSTCQFYQSKFDVMRPCNFHKVLKTSVNNLGSPVLCTGQFFRREVASFLFRCAQPKKG